MSVHFELPSFVSDIYPNPVQTIYGSPAVLYRDHRWILPVIRHAGDVGMLKPPTLVITFDRHRDALAPEDKAKVLGGLRASSFTFEELINCVKYHLSPRDDDWILAGMELGLVSDVIQFGGVMDEGVAGAVVTDYIDGTDLPHRIFHLDRPSIELSYKGALTDRMHEAAEAGLWECLSWNPSTMSSDVGSKGYMFDVDLDFFTVSWETYTFPFPRELYEGEFLRHCQSDYTDNVRPVDLVRSLAGNASVITVASEPQFCDGAEKSERILEDVNHLIFEDQMKTEDISVDYLPSYPSE